MAVLKGFSGGGVTNLDSFNVPYTVRSFIISNAESFPINTTVYISNGVDDWLITALDLTLKANQAYVRDSPIYVDKDNYIKISCSGTINYYFSID